MDDRELLKLARQAGFATDESDCPNEKYWFRVHGYGETLAKFAALVAAAERERCAKVCEKLVGAGKGYGALLAGQIRGMKD